MTRTHLPTTSRSISVDRRTILRSTVAGAALATVATVASPALNVLAQDASPVSLPDGGATPVGVPAALQYAYVGADSRTAIANGADAASTGISVFAVDPVSGGLTLLQTLVSDNAFYFTFHPTQQFLYAVNVIGDYEGTESGSVEAYAIDSSTGMLTFLNRQSSGGAVAAQPAVDPTGSFLVVANYNGENVVVLPINADGSLEPVIAEATRSGTGPDTVRQEKSHPHAAVFDPAGNFVVVADLGTDQVATYQLNLESGSLTLVSEVSTAAGAGPRHVVFNADGTLLYVVNELNATITIFSYDSATGMIGEELQTISTVPDPFVGTRSTAEILIHPSGTFLYNSNRGQPDSTTPEGDAIVAFSIDQVSGLLTLIGHTTEGIGVPWSFGFDASGQWLYAANYDDDTVTQYAINQDTGELSGPVGTFATPKPFVIAFSNA